MQFKMFAILIWLWCGSAFAQSAIYNDLVVIGKNEFILCDIISINHKKVVYYRDRREHTASIELLTYHEKDYLSSEAFDDTTEASFLGGPKKMQAFISKRLKFPSGARGDTIVISFIVSAKGDIEQVSVKNGGSNKSLQTEAVKVVKRMRRFIPAIYEGEFIRSKVYLPISYSSK